MNKYMFSNNKFNMKILIISIMFLLCFLFISYKLYDLIINKSEYYETKLSIKKNITHIGKYAKRGRILDRNGKVLVDNEEVYTLNYIKKTNVSSLEEIDISKHLIDILDLDYGNVTNKDIKNYIYVINYDNLYNKANKNVVDKYLNRTISKAEFENYLKKLITKEDIDNLKESDKKIAYVYSLMNKGYTNDIKLIKENITSEEAEKIKDYFKYGFEIGIKYKRVYPYGSTFRGYLGNIGNIPVEEYDK